MKRIVFYIFLLLAGLGQAEPVVPMAPYLPALSSKENDIAPITLQHPQENAKLPAGAENIYVFGKLNLENATLDINGQSVPVYKNGTFIAYIPVAQGTFDILMTAQSQGNTYQAVRHVIVPGIPINQFTDKARFDETQTYPVQPLWLLPGDTVQLSARGTPGAEVTATLSGLKNAKDLPLKENKRYPGLYQGQYSLAENEKPRSVKIRYRMHDPKTNTEAKITAKQKLKILDLQDPLPQARVTDSGSKLRQLPVHQGSLYPYYRAFGFFVIDGRDKGLYRVRLTNGEHAWIEEKKLELTAISPLPANHIEHIRTIAEPDFKFVDYNDVDAIRAAIDDKTAAVMLEPVQGEGGLIPAKPGYLQAVRDLCDEHGIMLLFDEVQCGMGRTGSFFAWQHFGVKPDAFSMAKAIANGFPMGAVLASEKYAKVLTPGTHASTFGGTPLACAAACAVIDTYDREKVLENVRARSAYLAEKLQGFVGKYPCVKGVRGLGLMIGLLLDRPAGPVLSILREKGMIALSAGETVLRMVPPLTVTQEDCEKAIALLDQALAQVSAN